MKILAIFAEKTLSLHRRVIAPYSVLCERGHSCHFMQSALLDPEVALTYDLVVLPNVVPDEALLARFQQVAEQGGRFVYDLSEPLLLKEQSVQALIALCGAVFVPNVHLAQEVSTLLRGHASHLSSRDGRASTKVSTIPSVVDRAYLFTGQGKQQMATLRQMWHIGEDDLVIGCLGREYDWEMATGDLKQVVERHKRVQILCEFEAYEVFHAEEALRPALKPIPYSLEGYPVCLSLCAFGLCPRQRADGRDTVGALDYGILHKPVIASATSYSRVFRHDEAKLIGPNGTGLAWEKAISGWIANPAERALVGHAAFERANRSRTSQAADRFLIALRENLPVAGRAR